MPLDKPDIQNFLALLNEEVAGSIETIAIELQRIDRGFTDRAGVERPSLDYNIRLRVDLPARPGPDFIGNPDRFDEWLNRHANEDADPD